MNPGVYLYFGAEFLTQGSFEDLQKLGIEPQVGLRLMFYDFDADEDGRPTYLCAEGVLYLGEGGHWCANIDTSTFHHVPAPSATR